MRGAVFVLHHLSALHRQQNEARLQDNPFGSEWGEWEDLLSRPFMDHKQESSFKNLFTSKWKFTRKNIVIIFIYSSIFSNCLAHATSRRRRDGSINNWVVWIIYTVILAYGIHHPAGFSLLLRDPFGCRGEPPVFCNVVRAARQRSGETNSPDPKKIDATDVTMTGHFLWRKGNYRDSHQNIWLNGGKI